MATYTILVPLDGSAFSRRAINYVSRFFHPSDYSITLMRVGDEPERVVVHTAQPLFVAGAFLSDMQVPTRLDAIEQPMYASQVRETAVAVLEDELLIEAKELRRLGYEVTVEARTGDPAEEIRRFAKNHGVDLIVMATHGRTGLRRLALGSVAADVVRHSRVPVMLIPPDEEPQAG